jgi:hypothetical protein
LEEQNARKEKRVIINMNDQFLNIETIMAAKEAQDMLQKAATTSNGASEVRKGRQQAITALRISPPRGNPAVESMYGVFSQYK